LYAEFGSTSMKSNYELLFCPCMQAIIKSLQDLCSMNKLCVHGKGYIVSRLHRLHTTASCAASTHHPAAQALPQPCHALRLLVTRPHGLYVNLAMHRDFSSPGCMGSTSTSSCVASTRLPTVAVLHRLRRTSPRHRLLGVRLPRLLTSTSLNQKTS
jgi:hypothetical protein